MKNQRGLTLIEILITVVFVFGLVFLLDTNETQKESLKKTAINEFLARDVDMQQVPMKGQKVFYAQVQIIYKDGKLESAKLVPKTTVSETMTLK